MRCEYGPTKTHFLGYYISALKGRCALKFLHALEIEQALPALSQIGMGVPPKNCNRENLKFALKFSVLATIGLTSGLVGVSHKTLSIRRAAGQES